jgi:hypothetical protein
VAACIGTKWPYVHWLTVPDEATGADVLTIVPYADALKTSHDVVLRADGTVAEAVPDAHGNNLGLPAHVDLVEPTAALEAFTAMECDRCCLSASKSCCVLLSMPDWFTEPACT